MQLARAGVSMKRLGAVLIVLFSAVLLACQLSYLLPAPEPSAAPRATRTKTPGSPAKTAVPTAPAAPQLPPPAPTSAPAVYATAKENLRLRSAPSASAQQIGSLNKGDTVQIVGRNAAGDWWQITHPLNPSIRAWISAAFVDVKGSVDTIPVVDANAVPAPQPYPGQPPAPIPPKTYP